MSFLLPSPGPHSEQILIPAQRGVVDQSRAAGNPDDTPVRWTIDVPPVFQIPTVDLGTTETFCLQSPLDCIYFRFYVDPDSLPIGVVGGDLQAEITIWNSLIDAATITSINSSFDICDLEGEPIQAPFTLGETELRTLVVKIPADGPAGQNETIDFVLTGSNGDTNTISIPISLIRAVLWHYPPHFEAWQQSFTFRTAVTVSEDGTEQRHSLTQNPRMTFGAEYWTVGDATPDIRAVMWSEDSVIAGDWSRSMVLEQTGNIGDSQLQVRANDVHFHPNQALLLVSGADPTNHTVELVEALPPPNDLPTVIALGNQLTREWPPGTRVVPAHFAVFSTDSDGEHRTNCFYVGNSEFRVLGDIKLPDIEPPMLDGIPVFEYPPDWNALPSWEIGHERTVIEGINNQQVYNHHFRGRSASGFQFWFKGQERIHEMLGWINLWKGRWKTFYMPTWVNDLTALRAQGSLVTSNGGGVNPQQRYNLQRGREGVFAARGEQLVYGKIVGVVPGPEETTLQIDPPLAQILNPGVAGYLQEVRLQDDRINIDFRARDFAVLTLDVQTV